MKKIFIPVLCAVLSFSAVAGASDLSGWAEAEYKAASSAGLIPYSMVSDRLTDSVTRAEFCEAVMNLYMIMKGKPVNLAKNPFSDTDNSAVIMAYTLGVINGKTKTEFYPNDPIKRQEMAKIVMRTINAADKDAHVTEEEIEKLIVFEDFGETDAWATTDIAKSIKYEIINGVSKTVLQPKGYATREQAIAILNRAYKAFADNKTTYEQPKFTDLYDGITLPHKFAFNWSFAEDPKEYIVIVKDAGYDFEASFTSNTKSIDLSDKGLSYNKSYTVLVGAKISDYITVFSDPVDVYYGTNPNTSNVITSLNDKYKRVFPNAKPFTSQAEAENNMRTVTFPVWKLGASGEKYSSTMSVVVNLNLADEVVKIFTEIYKSPEKFPIKDVGGYSWRTTAFGSVSQHSYGTCIDINWDENYYCYPSGEAIVGSFWRPYQSPFSIPREGSVVKAFSKYGWTWGGNWTNLKDYMHFSYLGK